MALMLVLKCNADVGSAFTVRGRIEYKYFISGAVAERQTNFFHISIADCKSVTRVGGLSAPDGRQVENYELYSTPEMSWFITVFKDQQDSKLRNADGLVLNMKKKQFEKSFNAFVDIYPNPFPPSHIGLISPVWAAYGSGCALQHGQESTYSLSFLGPGWPSINGQQLKCEVQSSTDAPHLPSQIIEYGDANVFQFVSEVQQNFFGQKPLPEIYKGGFTNSIYEVLSWTNFSGLKLPLRFQLTRYIPKTNGSAANDLSVLLVYEGVADSFEAKSVDLIVPSKAQEWSRITDYRFNKADGKPYMYTTKSGRILSRKELEKSGQASLSSERPFRSNLNVIRFVVIALMATPLIYYFVWRYREKTK